jgi:hypothetical protein
MTLLRAHILGPFQFALEAIFFERLLPLAAGVGHLIF